MASIPVRGGGEEGGGAIDPWNKKYRTSVFIFSVFACACFLFHIPQLYCSDSVVILTELLHVFFYAYVTSSIETCLNE